MDEHDFRLESSVIQLHCKDKGFAILFQIQDTLCPLLKQYFSSQEALAS